ncbi:Crp/Fnr family transcriptional regulator [Streptomyces hilarionis]|uniref:Crp/Fnr family transcriptional regulator n=1 Tax=Streptomyces hilarionis TaxID=2839954 RepID=UPI00211A2D74|nr:Crp/Fnr family transcriptional regulator [Streptomyces hilarionis]MCQ9134565.1 Crp/Fnr family transcriptional regulator [Streptomyces hilarionis]
MPAKADAPRLNDLLLGRAVMPEGSFLKHLPAPTWTSMSQEWDQRIRSYDRDKPLPLGPDGGDVFIIVQGCVRQERFPLGSGRGLPTIVRFRGIGEIVGEAKLIEQTSSVTTTCLSKTYVVPWRVSYMHRLQRKRPEVQLALLRSLEDRNRQDERVYATFAQASFQRVSTLLAHLAETAGIPDPTVTRRTIISGPTQKDLAAALQLGVSTVENAIGSLRRHGTIDAGYRKFIVHDLDALQDSATSA